MVSRSGSDRTGTPDSSEISQPRPRNPIAAGLRCFWRLVRPALVIYLFAVVLLMWFEESLIFIPSKYPEGRWTPPPDLPVEDVWFHAEDGVKLHGWYAPHPRPRAVILFCNGNAGNLSHRIDIVRALYGAADASVLVFDYRGYGRSEGSPRESGILADGRAARAFLAEKAQVAPDRVVLMGESLGGAVAVDLAADGGARALILEHTFDAMPNVAAHHYPLFPVRWLMRTHFDSASKIGRYHGPLLMTHGTADTIVPLTFGRSLFERANPPKQFLEIPGADHNDPMGRAYYEAIDRFLRDAP
jgi:fermentation-respiration switch protein FrsA (DUF1100 family)